jgi:hypothetical protein
MSFPVPTLTSGQFGPGYTRDWLPAYSFVLRARAMVLTEERTLSDTSGQDNFVLELGRQPPTIMCTDCHAPWKIDYSAHTKVQTQTQNYVTPQVCQLLRNISLFIWHWDRKRGSMWRTGERRREYGWRHKPATQKETYEESLLKILEQKKPTDTDEDVNFALSLVPIL